MDYSWIILGLCIIGIIVLAWPKKDSSTATKVSEDKVWHLLLIEDEREIIPYLSLDPELVHKTYVEAVERLKESQIISIQNYTYAARSILRIWIGRNKESQMKGVLSQMNFQFLSNYDKAVWNNETSS